MRNLLPSLSFAWDRGQPRYSPNLPCEEAHTGQVLAEELDVSYAILPWSSKLQKGEALRKEEAG